MNILITGGAGYIGSVLAPHLLGQGHSVTVVDNLMYRQTSLLDCCTNPNFEFIRGDACVENVVAPLMKKADCVIPLAAIVGAPACDRNPIGAKAVNLEAVQLLCKLRSPNQRFLVPITNSGYGVGEKGKFCTEESPLKPISLYGQTKVSAEECIFDSGDAISFRLATVFGASPRMRMDLLVNDFVYRAVTDRVVVLFEAHFKRNYLHVRDVARAFGHGIKNYETMKGRPYNVGLSDANLSKAELCGQIQEHIPNFVYIESEIGQDPDKRDYIVSNERIESTGWKPEFSLDDGIRELIQAYRIVRANLYSNA